MAIRGGAALLFAVSTLGCAGPGASDGALPLRGDRRVSDGTLVVCVHGWCADASYFDAFRREWPGAAVAVDLPGHGRAAWDGEVHVAELGLAVATTVDGLGAREVIWIGHGMGGAVALSAAAQASTPSLGLLALDCLHDLDRALPAEQWSTLVEAYRADFAGTLRAFAKQAIPAGTLDAELARAIAEDLVLQERAPALEMLAALPGARPEADRAATGLPIHAVLADLDQEVDAAGNAGSGDYSHVVLDRSGHFLMIERPAEVAAILEARLGAWARSNAAGAKGADGEPAYSPSK